MKITFLALSSYGSPSFLASPLLETQRLVKPIISPIVTSLEDHGPGSLRQALLEVTRKGIIKIKVPGNIKITSTLEIDEDITIEGYTENSHDQTIISGYKRFTIFNIKLNKVTLKNLILEDGQGYKGGAIYTEGELTLENIEFRNNSAEMGGALYNIGVLKLEDCIFYNNFSRSHGGALVNANEVVSEYSIFQNNYTNVLGGAIYNEHSAKISLFKDTFINNMARNRNREGGEGDNFYNEGKVEGKDVKIDLSNGHGIISAFSDTFKLDKMTILGQEDFYEDE